MSELSPLLDLIRKASADIAHDVVHIISGFRAVDFVIIGLGILVVRAIYLFVRLWKSDCDLQLSRAMRKQPKKSLEGKVILITGASSGIGQALACEYASHGATLILAARRMDRLLETVDRCLEHGGQRVEAVRLDITQIDTHERILKPIIEKYGQIHILVNNAGRSQRALVENTSIEVDKEMFHLNVIGTMSISKILLRHFLDNGEGHFVNTSSVAGKVGAPISATYSATKHALHGFFDSLYFETAHRGIKVTNVCPGPVQSEISLHAFTGEPGRAHGDANEPGTKRMSVTRCARLICAATWAGLPEAWIAEQPILLFGYIGQYWRQLYFYIGTSLMGPMRVNAYNKGLSGYGSFQKGFPTLVRELFARPKKD